MKKITNKLLWIFAVGQFGWSLLSGIVSTWLIHLYTGTPEKLGDTNGQFRRFVYADVIYFFAVTLFQTGLADFETRLMKIPSDNTFLLTVVIMWPRDSTARSPSWPPSPA